VRLVPLQTPPHDVPVPAQGVLGVVTGTQMPGLAGLTHDSHWPLHAMSQQTPSEPHTPLEQSAFAAHAVPLVFAGAPPLPLTPAPLAPPLPPLPLAPPSLPPLPLAPPSLPAPPLPPLPLVAPAEALPPFSSPASPGEVPPVPRPPSPSPGRPPSLLLPADAPLVPPKGWSPSPNSRVEFWQDIASKTELNARSEPAQL
jgi:hypothetical protein